HRDVRGLASRPQTPLPLFRSPTARRARRRSTAGNTGSPRKEFWLRQRIPRRKRLVPTREPARSVAAAWSAKKRNQRHRRRIRIRRGTLAWKPPRSEEHTSELQSRGHLVCRLLLEKKKKKA